MLPLYENPVLLTAVSVLNVSRHLPASGKKKSQVIKNTEHLMLCNSLAAVLNGLIRLTQLVYNVAFEQQLHCQSTFAGFLDESLVCAGYNGNVPYQHTISSSNHISISMLPNVA